MPRLSQELLDLCGLSLIDGSVKSRKKGKRRPHLPLRYEFIEGAHADASKKKSKRNANRKRNKKAPVLGERNDVEKECKITWGDVNQFYFKRAVGYGTVPSKGAYPLGFGAEEEAMHECSTVDSHQNSVEANLLVRAHQIGIPIPSVPRDDKGAVQLPALETRQLDYKKSGSINPLFGPLSEEDRVVILGDTLRGSKSRSGSMVDADKGSRSRSGSLIESGIPSSRGGDHGGDAESANDTEPSIAALNKELSHIRQGREESRGCTCRPIKIDKLSVVKMKAELVENEGILCIPAEVDGLSKGELTSLLKEKLKNCPLCVASNCVCVQAGIECRADTCDCLRRTGGPQYCANPQGRSGFDSASVHLYRQAILEEVQRV